MPRAPFVLVLAAVLAAACQSSSTPQPRLALADEVERIAELLDRDQPCRALDVAEALPVHDEALEAPARDAVAGFVTDLRETVQCPASPPSPTSTPSPTTPEPPAGDDEDDDADDDEGEGEDRGQGDGEGNGNGNGNGGDDDDKGPPDNPGRGNKGRDGGNGPGRGND